MRPDQDRDWNNRTAKLSQRRTAERRPEIQAVRRAALSAAHVTGDEHWDLLLSVVQERIEAQQKQLDLAVELLKTSDDFTTEDLINQKLAVRLFGREIEVLQWVIGLPEILKEQGDRADELLGTIDKSSG